MSMLKEAHDQVSWLFFPARFLYAKDRPRQFRVWGWETIRFVDNQREVRAVNEATGDVFLGGGGNEFLKTLLGPQSVFLLDHERHRLARRILGTALTRHSHEVETAGLDRHVDEALDRAERRWMMALGPWCRSLTMRTMCHLVLGIEDASTARLYYRRFERVTGYLSNIASYHKSVWEPRGPVSLGAVAAHLVGRLDRVISTTITERRRQGATGESPLDALLRAQDEHHFDDRFIRDNLIALLAAGYETTGAAVAWMLYWLSRTGAYPRLQAKRQAGDTAYLEAFRDECLRYCPPVEILPRKVADGQREAAVRVLPDLAQTGSDAEPPMVCPCVHRVHHDSSVHAHPQRFEPDRFLRQTYRSTEFLPFGLGPRFCLGAALGTAVLDRVLDRLLARGLRFDLHPSSFRPVRRNVSLWPGVFLLARVRHAPDELA